MLTLRVTGLEDAMAEVKDLSQRSIAAAAATALTRTAVKARTSLQSELRSRLDNPTPYTVRAIKYAPAAANRLVAAVGFDVAAIQDVYGNVVRFEQLGSGETPAGRYMAYQAEGGSRTEKRFEKALQAVGVLPKGWRAVPGQRAKMTPYGNQSVGEIKQILSWFDAAEANSGSTQNMRAAGRAKRMKGTSKKAGFEYFVIAPNQTRQFMRSNGKAGTHKAQPGIYRRTNLALGSRIEPVIIFVKSATYSRRFDFYGIAERESMRHLLPEFDRAIEASRARLSAKVSQ